MTGRGAFFTVALVLLVQTMASIGQGILRPGGDLGTPSAGVMTNVTGIPVGALADGTDGQLITWGTDASAETVAVGTATHVLTSNGAGAVPTFQVAGGGSVSVLDSGFGSLTSTSGGTLDSVAISGLTALDSIRIVGSFFYESQNAVVGLDIENTTDSLVLAKLDINSAGIAGKHNYWELELRNGQKANTHIGGLIFQFDQSAVQDGDDQNMLVRSLRNVMTTAWTGSWTLALTHEGVVSGGTTYWKWVVYKVAGQ